MHMTRGSRNQSADTSPDYNGIKLPALVSGNRRCRGKRSGVGGSCPPLAATYTRITRKQVTTMGKVILRGTGGYYVTERKGWSYVKGPSEYSDGPWRYRWEAEERAEELNRSQATR